MFSYKIVHTNETKDKHLVKYKNKFYYYKKRYNYSYDIFKVSPDYEITYFATGEYKRPIENGFDYSYSSDRGMATLDEETNDFLLFLRIWRMSVFLLSAKRDREQNETKTNQTD